MNALSIIDPIAASSGLQESYTRYLSTLLPLTDARLRAAVTKQLQSTGVLSKGPYLESTPAFESGASLETLIAEGVLPQSFDAFDSHALPLSRPLYLHQEQAIRKAREGRNLVVATGTGSGKTESFLVPVFASLFDELQNLTLSPGVRALLLYPMNALANDQLKRLRELLANKPEVTFGRYTGETLETREKAVEKYWALHGEEPLPNEILSREEMRANPPHILLTNYAMLEYLLLRPADMELFEGKHGGNWKFLVVDEAHVYDGINGSEIALLLRRLQERVKAPNLQCLASSATVGDDLPKVAEFATNLFNKPFEWVPTDASKQDVVEATRVIQTGPSRWRMDQEQLDELFDSPDPDVLVNSWGYATLEDEAHVQLIIEQLSTNPQTIVDLSKVVFPEDDAATAARNLTNLVEIAHHAHGLHGTPILNARYHQFVTATDGAFVCLSNPDDPHVEFSRHIECPTCEKPMFEIAACKQCGKLHVLGNMERRSDGDYLRSKARENGSRLTWVMLGTDQGEGDPEDDYLTPGEELTSHSNAVNLCLDCSCLTADLSQTKCIQCGSSNLRTGVRTDAAVLRECHSCGVKSNDQIRRLSAGYDASISVLITSLYGALPADDRVNAPGDGRKLLMFADSRQQAAYAAPSLENSYQTLLHRRLLAMSLEERSFAQQTSNELAEHVLGIAQDHCVFNRYEEQFDRSNRVFEWIHKESLESAERLSLEGSGLATVRLKRPETPLLQGLSQLGLSSDEAWDLMEELATTMRVAGALSPRYKTGKLNVQSEFFAPRNREKSFVESGSTSKGGIESWLPSGNAKRNKRVSYLERVLKDLESDLEPITVLSALWKYLTNPQVGWLTKTENVRQGVSYQVDNKALRWQLVGTDTPLYQCAICQRFTPRSVRNICPANRCTGTLQLVNNDTIAQRNKENHYVHTYKNLSPVPLSAREHTAQLSKDAASATQNEFIEGKINVLSCSTTFEMGVDVGELQAVFLRNVPPATANYIQRAGRAGRRASSAALVTTFVQMRSHDQYMFANPIQMIKGLIRPPYIDITNERVARRHAHSIALSAFWRNEVAEGRTYRSSIEMLGELAAGESGAHRFTEYLLVLPDQVRKSIKEVLPSNLYKDLDVDGNGFVDVLIERVKDVKEVFTEETDFLEEQILELISKRKFAPAEALQHSKRTVEGRQIIGEFARYNVLPKYGFPVDTVPLKPSGNRKLEGLDLSRDLAIAINEYAPGNKIVAAGDLISSVGIAKPPGKDFVEYKYVVCKNCEHLSTSIGGLEEQCSSCKNPYTGSPNVLIRPEWGFIASPDTQKVGSARPKSSWNSRLFVIGAGEEQDLRNISTSAGRLSMRVAERAKLCMLNEGPNNSRYMLCTWCGYSVPGTLLPRTRTGKLSKLKPHQHPRSGKECAGHLHPRALAHTYETDILSIQFESGATADQARSMLYAILNAASEHLELSRDDLDGTVETYNNNTIAIFDTVPAGAGLVKRIADHIEGVIDAAFKRVDSCDCGIDTSCYRCLRVFRNQRYHEVLSRKHVLDLRR